MRKTITIAGSDSSGGAGIQTDLKTFSSIGVYGMSAITSVTAQNTLGITKVENISPAMVKEQIRVVLDDIGVDSVKIGMLANKEIIESVYEILNIYKPKNIVLDPVMVSTSGFDLLNSCAKEFMVNNLMPLVDLVTPNLNETTCILNIIGCTRLGDIDTVEKMILAGKEIHEFTKNAVLIKGGHLNEEPCDVLIDKDGHDYVIVGKRITTLNTHGTGCTLSSAISAYLALGYTMKESVVKGKDFISDAILYSIDIGKGSGPTNPMGRIYKELGMEV